MAEPGTTPPVPVNPFSGGGAEQNVDKQKALLNDLIAMQGQGARTLYERQGAEAQGLLQQRLAGAGTVPDARKAVYDAFTQDARAADQQHAQTVQRQSQLGSMFMDQAKAAVPIHAKNVDATTEAMRMQFEERRQKEADQYALQQQQIRASSASRSQSLSGAALGREKGEQEVAFWKVTDPDGTNPLNPTTRTGTTGAGKITDKQKANLEVLTASGIPREQWSTKDVLAAGVSGAKVGFKDAVWSVGLRQDDPLLTDGEGIDLAQSEVDELFNGDKDVTFEQVIRAMKSLVSVGAISAQLADVTLYSNAPRWGVTIPEREDRQLSGPPMRVSDTRIQPR